MSHLIRIFAITFLCLKVVTVKSDTLESTFSTRTTRDWETTTESEITTVTEPPLKSYSCKMDDAGYCVFRNVYLPREAYRFVPIAENISAEYVDKIIFLSSDMEIFGPDICMTFPNLEALLIESSHIKQFAPGAFWDCTQLWSMSARYNHLKKLTAKTFEGLDSIKHLRLMDNEIEEIDDDTFYAFDSLAIVELQNNKLREFSSAIAAKMCKVHELRLDANELFDIDVESMLGQSFGRICLTNLWLFGIDDNNLNCHRIPSIVNSFKQAGLTTLQAFPYKYRSYSTKFVNDYKCLGEAEWAALFVQKSNLAYLNEIKRLLKEEL